MITINCIAVDDEPPALKQMQDYISRVPYLNLLSTFTNPINALEYMKVYKVDLLFLDIQMENINGMQLLNLLTDKPKVILTTAYDSYAIEAFSKDVNDYLLKPFSFERFLKATEKIYNELQTATLAQKETQQVTEKENYFFIKTEFRVEKVVFNDILYIEGLKEYLGICTSKKRVLTLKSFDDILKILPSDNFIRVHKSFIVAVDKIDSIEGNQIKISDKKIPIGPKFKEAFFLCLKNRNLM